MGSGRLRAVAALGRLQPISRTWLYDIALPSGAERKPIMRFYSVGGMALEAVSQAIEVKLAP